LGGNYGTWNRIQICGHVFPGFHADGVTATALKVVDVSKGEKKKAL
jgi:hypothetical protein